MSDPVIDAYKERERIWRIVAEQQDAAYARGKRRLHLTLGFALGLLVAYLWGLL